MFDFIMNYIQESEPMHLVMQTVTVTVMLMSIVWLLFFGGKDSKWEGGLEFGESESTGTESGSAKDRCSACENPATKKLDLQDEVAGEQSRATSCVRCCQGHPGDQRCHHLDAQAVQQGAGQDEGP